MKPEKTIILARHGKTRYNDEDLLQGRIDLPLSETGLREAERLAEALKDEPLDIVFHSPLARARETAEIVNRRHQLEMKTIESFYEIDMGDWEGLNYFDMIRDNAEFHQAWMQDPGMQVPGGESFTQVFERVRPGVEEVLASPFRHILILGHAAVNRGILAALTRMKPEPSRMFRMKNCAYSKFLVYKNGRDRYTIVDSWNNHAHLEDNR